MKSSSPSPRGRLSISIVAALSLLILFHSFSSSPLISSENYSGLRDSDIFVIVRTGACEDRSRIKTLLRTSLREAPSTVIFSDLSEIFDGLHLRDALSGAIDQKNLDSVDDFVLYKKLLKTGTCDGLTEADLTSEGVVQGNGNWQSRSWNLDRWKWLPMIEKAWEMQNGAKWYILVEPDTFIIWSNLLKWLATMDHRMELYAGGKGNYGEYFDFAYGGSGVILSSAAMEKLVGHMRGHRAVQDTSLSIWCGDCVLGSTVKDAGIRLLRADHEMIRDPIGDGFHFGGSWCEAAVAYHHMTPAETRRFSKFLEKWTLENPAKTLRQSDVFRKFLLPQFVHARDDWDNRAKEEVKTKDDRHLTIDDCREFCKRKSSCLQYRLARGKCFTWVEPTIGHAPKPEDGPVSSGWMVDRIEAWAERRTCDMPWQGGWPQPSYFALWHKIVLIFAVSILGFFGLLLRRSRVVIKMSRN